MNILKVGIAGYGVVGKTRRKCVEKNPQLQLIALCDKNFTKDSFDLEGVKICQDYYG